MSQETSTVAPAAQPSTSPPPLPTASLTALSTSPPKEPTALATTKRKFHKLLEGLTRTHSSSSHDGSTTTNRNNTHDSPAKRIRLEARRRLDASTPSNTSAATAYIQSQLLSARLAAARKPRVSGEGEAPVKKAEELNYSPWSHEQFLRRLKTYADVRLWTSKPDAVDEVQWAKRGWVCVGVNLVACKGGCEQRVAIALRPRRKDEEGQEIEDSEDYDVEVDEELVRRYVELITTGHEESCLWRGAGCRDDIYRLPIAKASIWQPQLRDRYFSFQAIEQYLPALTILSLPADVATVAVQLPDSFFTPPDVVSEAPTTQLAPEVQTPSSPSTPPPVPSSRPNLPALAFALTGWTASPSAPSTPSALATCPACFRRLGLWLYTTPASPSSNLLTLDLLSNHRTYCPWTSASSQQMPGSFAGLPAWEILTRLIRNSAAPATAVPFSPSSSPSASLPAGAGVDSIAREPGAEVDGDGDERVGAAARSRGVVGGVGRMRKNKDEVEREDKARFARLRELTRAMGLRRTKKA